MSHRHGRPTRARLSRTAPPAVALSLATGLLAGFAPAGAWATDAPSGEGPAAAPELPSYSLVHIGTRVSQLEGVVADSLSDAGHVTGHSFTATSSESFLWKQGLFVSREPITEHRAVNAQGDTVGYEGNDVDGAWGADQAYLFDRNGGRFLPLLPGDIDARSDALDINDAGVAVGYADDTSRRYLDQPVRWASGAIELLPELPGHLEGRATGINDDGVVVGEVRTATGTVPVRWRNDVPERLEGLRHVQDINDQGVLLALTEGGVSARHVRWSEGDMEVLEHLEGDLGGFPKDMNDSGDVIGVSAGEPVLWPGGSTTPVPLQSLVADQTADLEWAQAINDRGEILAWGRQGGLAKTWLLQPAAQPVHLSAVAVEQPAVPGGEWVPVPDEGTIDGNRVRLRATVRNPEATAKEVRLIVRRGSEVLTRTPLTATVPARGTVDVPLEWDSTGTAWQDGAPAAPQEFSVRLFVDGEEVDEQQKAVPVRPRPLVLVHGFNADASTWSAYPPLVRGVRADWPVFAVGDGKAPGAMNTGSLTDPTAIPSTIVDNAQVMAGYVEGLRDQLDAQNVDIVAHSMGGLISRQYIESFMPRDADGDNVATRLLMLGTPNQGSPCASLLPLAGMYELRPEVVAAYNERMPNAPGVPMSVLAGKPLPFTCDVVGQGDGVVAVPSALTGYADTAQNYRIHTALTQQEDFAGFVLPRLVGSAPYGGGTASFDALALTTAGSAGSSPQLLSTGNHAVVAGGTAEVPVDVVQAGHVGVSYVAPASVTAELLDSSGAVVAASPAGEDSPVRTLRVVDPADGRYTLRLGNTGDDAVTVPASLWVTDSALHLGLTSVKADAAGRVEVSATLTRDGAPLPGGTVTARLTEVGGGTSADVALVAAPDGGYHGRSARLPAGEFFAEVTAEVDGTSRSTLSSVVVEEATELDTTAPVVTATRPEPSGHEGWDSGPVTVSLDASDEDGGSGVAGVVYTVAGGDEQTVAGSAAAITVAAEGDTEVRYWAVDAAGNVAPARTLTVRIDSQAPAATCTPSMSRIWPPDHRLVPVTVTCTVEDTGSGEGATTLIRTGSSEPDDARGGGDGATTGDVAGWAAGTADMGGQLRAERRAPGPGRTYTLTYQVSDIAGNTLDVPVAVRVAKR